MASWPAEMRGRGICELGCEYVGLQLVDEELGAPRAPWCAGHTPGGEEDVLVGGVEIARGMAAGWATDNKHEPLWRAGAGTDWPRRRYP